MNLYDVKMLLHNMLLFDHEKMTDNEKEIFELLKKDLADKLPSVTQNEIL